MDLGRNWKIESDKLNVILLKKKVKKKKDTGEVFESWATVGYFSTIASALHGLVNQGVKDTQLKDLKTISEAIDKLHALIEQHFKRLQALPEALETQSDSLHYTTRGGN